jgi:hypothetical protein
MAAPSPAPGSGGEVIVSSLGMDTSTLIVELVKACSRLKAGHVP